MNPNFRSSNNFGRPIFREHRKKPESVFENINAVPLEYLNQALAAGNEGWRVRIVDGDEYEFYVPGH